MAFWQMLVGVELYVILLVYNLSDLIEVIACYHVLVGVKLYGILIVYNVSDLNEVIAF